MSVPLRVLTPGCRISGRSASVSPCTIMDTMSEARALERIGRRVIHFEVGQPCSPAPAAARAAAAAAMSGRPLGYTDATGLPELRERIVRHYAARHGVHLDPARIIVTAGASAGFVLALTNLFDPGDQVAVCDPGYPGYRNMLRSLSLAPVGVPTRPERGFQPIPPDLRPGLAGIVLASPANPTGSMIARPDLTELVHAAADRGISVISDEVYHGIEYGAPAVSALEISDDVYVINSFSKYFAMTGWRVGWMVVPPGHVRAIEALMQNLFICAPHVGQIAALAALDAGAELARHVALYRANRDLLLDGLPKAGFSRLAPPDGAFFLFADVSDLTDDSRALTRQILHECGVALTPGNDFDPGRGRRYVRLCYACGQDQVREGLSRLQDWAARRP